jgi:hypothetical protein
MKSFQIHPGGGSFLLEAIGESFRKFCPDPFHSRLGKSLTCTFFVPLRDEPKVDDLMKLPCSPPERLYTKIGIAEAFQVLVSVLDVLTIVAIKSQD